MRKQRGVALFALSSGAVALLVLHGCSGDDASAPGADSGGGSDTSTSDQFSPFDAALDAGDSGRADPGIRISLQDQMGCALKSGALECWGDNSYGGRANGTCDPTPGITPVSLGFAPSAMSVGQNFVCASGASSVLCWGRNDIEQNGSDPVPADSGAACGTAGQPVPVAVPGVTAPSTVDASYDTACALDSGHAVCWGNAASGGTGLTDGGARSGPNVVGGTDGATALAVGSEFGCVLKGDASVWCWGSNGAGGLATTPDANPHPTASKIALGQGVLQIAVAHAGFSVCALLADHTVQCWGYNGGYGGGLGGELGHDPSLDPACPGGTDPCSSTPTTVDSLSNVRELSMGYKHTCAVLMTDDIMCWGENEHGELGHDPSVDPDGGPGHAFSFTPIRVTGMASVAHVFAGDGTTCAVTWSGDVYCWGRTDQIPGGDGGAGSFIPVKVSL